MTDNRKTLESTCNASARRARNASTGRNRGVVIYYMTAIMIALCGFCSMAVDLGRVQVVKCELHRSADAAARAAASVLPDYVTATSLATQYARANTADGQPVDLDAASDIEFGTWTSSSNTFTVLTGSARSNANAVRVTARRTAARNNATPLLFGKVLGVGSCNATASAIASLKATPAMNVVGINGIQMTGSDRIDSYDSTNGAYSSATADDTVNVASNGSISIGGSSTIQGNAYYGSSSAPSGSISGTIQPLDAPLSYPAPTLPATYTSQGAVSLQGSQTLTLAAGNHYFTSLSMSGSAVLKVTGPVKLYVQGAFTMDGNAGVTVAGNAPANLEIYVMSSATVSLDHNDLYAKLYAPLSTVSMNGNADVFGSVIAGNIQMNGNNTIHYDESLTTAPPASHVVLVK